MAHAQSTDSTALISVIHTQQGSQTTSSRLTSTFPRTETSSSGSTQSVQFSLNKDLVISKLNIPTNANGKQEFTVEGISGCNADASFANLAGTTCTVTVHFTPAYPGLRTFPLQVSTNEGTAQIVLSGFGVAPLAALTPGYISTVVGTGTANDAGDGGLATEASLFNPLALAIDSSNNLYIATGGYYIRKVDGATGVISTIAGNGVYANTGDGGLATQAAIGVAQTIALGSDGALYMASGSATDLEIRRLDLSTGIITKVAGNGTYTYSGDGGLATQAGLSGAIGLAIDSANNIYIADSSTYRIRKIDAATGIISTYAGTGTMGSTGDGGAATSATLWPAYLAVDASDNLFFSALDSGVIRKINASTGVVTTVAGSRSTGNSGDGGTATSALFGQMAHINLDLAGQLYISDMINQVIRKIDVNGIVSTIAGNGVNGFTGDGKLSTSAEFSFPYDVQLNSAGDLYIVDENNMRIRMISASKSAINFPTETTANQTDTTDGPLSVVLTNIGNATLTLATDAAATNPKFSTSDFIYSSTSTCPQTAIGGAAATLPAATACKLAVEFAPQQAGSIASTLTLTDDAANVQGALQTIDLTGTASASNADATTTAVVSTGSTRYSVGQSVTLSAVVSDTTSTTSSPTGSVIFTIYNGTTLLATSSSVNVIGGVASYSYSPTVAGTLTVKASYISSNTAIFASSKDSTGQSLTIVGSFTVSIPTNVGNNIGITISDGFTVAKNGPAAVISFTTTPGTGGFPAKVSFTASGLPSQALVAFSPATLAQDATATTGTLTVNVSQVNLSSQTQHAHPFGDSTIALGGFLLLGTAALRKRRAAAPLLMAGLLFMTISMTGCMQSTAPKKSSYTLVITATSGTATQTASVPFSITY